jgi:hypothetical protein
VIPTGIPAPHKWYSEQALSTSKDTFVASRSEAPLIGHRAWNSPCRFVVSYSTTAHRTYSIFANRAQNATTPLENKMTPTTRASKLFKKHVVHFSNIEIIESSIILGDHPSTSAGPPIQQSWDACRRTTVDLNNYEATRSKRRIGRALILSSRVRIKMLRQNGYDWEEMNAASQGSERIKKDRMKTIQGLKGPKAHVNHGGCMGELNRRFDRMSASCTPTQPLGLDQPLTPPSRRMSMLGLDQPLTAPSRRMSMTTSCALLQPHFVHAKCA